MFPRDSSGRSSLFPIKEESVTSSPFSKRPNGKEPSRVGLLLPLTRAPLPKTPTGSAGPASSSRTLTHVCQAASVPVEQEEEPTLRDEPVVTPRLPVRSAGRYSRKSMEESHFSSSRSSLEPPTHSGAVRAASRDFLRRAKVTRGQKPWVRIHLVLPRPGVPGRGHYGPKLPRSGVAGRGHCRPKFPTRLPTDWDRRLLTLLSNSPQTK